MLAKLFGNVGDGLLDDIVWAVLKFSENKWIGEGLGQALVIDDGAVYAKGGSSLVLVVEDCIRKALLESSNVSEKYSLAFQKVRARSMALMA